MSDEFGEGVVPEEAMALPSGLQPQSEEGMNADEFDTAVMLEINRQILMGYDIDHDLQGGIIHLCRHALVYIRKGDKVKAAAMVQAIVNLDPVGRRAPSWTFRDKNLPWVKFFGRRCPSVGYFGGNHHRQCELKYKHDGDVHIAEEGMYNRMWKDVEVY